MFMLKIYLMGGMEMSVIFDLRHGLCGFYNSDPEKEVKNNPKTFLFINQC